MTQRSQLISFVIRSELAAKQIIGTITKKIISSNLFLFEYVKKIISSNFLSMSTFKMKNAGKNNQLVHVFMQR